ncbi:MAG: hypothetical protein K0R98_1842 [Rickettsiaceae bacterium]|jgi:hypothetical protein|nr:hypothetical protein [Rickettsiaceae bacterium]
MNELINFNKDILNESIAGYINELNVDAVGLWQIVNEAHRVFKLQDKDLVGFVKKHIESILNAGASPVWSKENGKYDWTLATEYGDTVEKITNSIITEWEKQGLKELNFDSIWFALPKFFKD